MYLLINLKMGKLLGVALQPFSRSFLSLENYKLETDPDYTLAFQRAIDALPESTGFEAGGGIIMLDGKDYRISGTIYAEKSVAIWGAGSDSGTSISLAENSNCNMFEFGKRNSSDPVSLDLRGLRIQMLGAQADGFSNIVTYNYIRHSHFVDLFIVGATAPNFEMKQDAGQQPGRNNYFYGCAFEYGKGSALKILHDYNLNINSCYFGFGVDGQSSYGLFIDMTADRFIVANSWFLQDSRAGNMYVTGPFSGHIVNNKWNGVASGANAGSAHLVLSNCGNINVGSNIMGATNYPYAVKILSGCNKIKVFDNQIGSVATQPLLFDDKSKVECYNNSFGSGKQSESGSATILDTTTYIEVIHGCFTTPDNVIATPQGNENVWISNIGATTFRINRAASSGALICNWKASVKTY